MPTETHNLYARVPVDLYRSLCARARTDDQTMAQAVRAALRQYLGATEYNITINGELKPDAVERMTEAIKNYEAGRR
jgi:phage protein U